MATKVHSPVDVVAHSRLVEQFHGETERAAVILGGCYLDSMLEQLLRTKMVDGLRTDHIFARALRPLAAKIDLAFALNLAPDLLCADMHRLNGIRNHYAHHLWDASFEHPKVKQLMESLEIINSVRDQTGKVVGLPNPPREKYLIAIGLVQLNLVVDQKAVALNLHEGGRTELVSELP